jgi:hypothetical protein
MGKMEYVPVSEIEMVALMERFESVSFAFGSGGAALKWEKGTPMPDTVRHVGLMRGVLNQNTDGAGI